MIFKQIFIAALGSYSTRPYVIRCMTPVKKTPYIDHKNLYVEPDIANWFSCVLVNTELKDFVMWCYALILC